jgi:hypothetical protein
MPPLLAEAPVIPTPSPSRPRPAPPQNHSTYDRRISREVARLDPETQDAIVQCNPGGCAITALEVEKNLSGTYPVIPGSLRFRDDAWTDEENTALFTMKLLNGGSILGSVTIKAVVEATKVTAYSDIKIIHVKDHPVALLPKKKPETGAENVVARLFGWE